MKTMKTHTASTLVSTALPILGGLLASGKYHHDQGGEPILISTDIGKGWRDEGIFARRHVNVAVEHALMLAGELLDTAELDTLPLNQQEIMPTPAQPEKP